MGHERNGPCNVRNGWKADLIAERPRTVAIASVILPLTARIEAGIYRQKSSRIPTEPCSEREQCCD